MINDHLPGTSCSIHGSSRVDELTECSIDTITVNAKSSAVAVASLIHRPSIDVRIKSSRVSVLILMCTYNGQLFLEKQLDSISAQTCHDWHVAISDDGSQDQTLAIAKRYKLAWGEDRLSVWRGPGEGFARNFISSVCRKELSADHYAWRAL